MTVSELLCMFPFSTACCILIVKVYVERLRDDAFSVGFKLTGKICGLYMPCGRNCLCHEEVMKLFYASLRVEFLVYLECFCFKMLYRRVGRHLSFSEQRSFFLGRCNFFPAELFTTK
jgi:hypothetical protein